MKKELVTTSDGSHSVFLPEMDEHYHSMHGAIAESEHVYIKNGLLAAAKQKKSIQVFEVGLGTGLNVLTTYKSALANQLKVIMDSIEAYPLDWEEVKSLNFRQQLDIEKSIYKQIHQSDWDAEVELSPQLTLHKYHDKLQHFDLAENSYDVIYFDAFAPEKQEEMWSEAIFKKLYTALKPGGILVTYCVKGEIRRRLQDIGLKVEKLKGPEGGKREIMRAVKSER
ncbi:MAG: tRNA (5-methylaminomethyl-2-thiouridine)(34)-methyltransferase MnmD [Vicingaceae bacterium]